MARSAEIVRSTKNGMPMFRALGIFLLSPLFVAAILLRLAFFLSFALLFLLPMAITRPRLLLRAPRMLQYLLMPKRSGWGGCDYGRWAAQRLERLTEPVRT